MMIPVLANYMKLTELTKYHSIGFPYCRGVEDIENLIKTTSCKRPILREDNKTTDTEAEFLDVIGKKVFRVFLLAIHSHLY